MPETITIDGRAYTRVPRARVSDPDVVVYHGPGEFLRLGKPLVIERYLEIHRQMAASGIPIPELLGSGAYEHYGYYRERSLGDLSFAQRLGRECSADFKVADSCFSDFLKAAEVFLTVQAHSKQHPRDEESFVDMIHYRTLLTELPRYAPAINRRYEKAMAALAGIPYVLSHGDFNPANMYPGGAIDIEHAMRAPLGYDAVTAIETSSWFVQNEETKAFSHYEFTDAQRTAYRAMCARVYEDAIPIERIWDDLAFCRALWLTARMHKWPDTQRYRYNRFIEKYLSK